MLSGDYDVLKNSILDQDWKTSIGKAKCSPSSRFIGDIAELAMHMGPHVRQWK